METPKKPEKKPISKVVDDEEDDDIAEESTSKKEELDDDDEFDLPIDDIGGFDEIGFDDDDDF